MNHFSTEEIKFLKDTKFSDRNTGRWLYDDNKRSRIDEFVERGLMQPAYGEFGPPQDEGEELDLFGKTIPIVRFISLYMLTYMGRRAFREEGKAND